MQALLIITVPLEDLTMDVLGGDSKPVDILETEVVVHALSLVYHIMVADKLISFLSPSNFVWALNVVSCNGDSYNTFINEIHFRNFLILLVNELVIDIVSLEPSWFHSFSKFSHEKAVIFHSWSHFRLKEAVMLFKDVLE